MTAPAEPRSGGEALCWLTDYEFDFFARSIRGTGCLADAEVKLALALATLRDRISAELRKDAKTILDEGDIWGFRSVSLVLKHFADRLDGVLPADSKP